MKIKDEILFRHLSIALFFYPINICILLIRNTSTFIIKIFLSTFHHHKFFIKNTNFIFLTQFILHPPNKIENYTLSLIYTPILYLNH